MHQLLLESRALASSQNETLTPCRFLAPVATIRVKGQDAPVPVYVRDETAAWAAVAKAARYIKCRITGNIVSEEELDNMETSVGPLCVRRNNNAG